MSRKLLIWLISPRELITCGELCFCRAVLLLFTYTDHWCRLEKEGKKMMLLLLSCGGAVKWGVVRSHCPRVCLSIPTLLINSDSPSWVMWKRFAMAGKGVETNLLTERLVLLFFCSSSKVECLCPLVVRTCAQTHPFYMPPQKFQKTVLILIWFKKIL